MFNDLVIYSKDTQLKFDFRWMGDALEINMQRSTLGLLHGNTARWIVPPSDNLTAVFSHISNFTDECKCYIKFYIYRRRIEIIVFL